MSLFHSRQTSDSTNPGGSMVNSPWQNQPGTILQTSAGVTWAPLQQPGGPMINGQGHQVVEQPGYVYQSQTNLPGGQLSAPSLYPQVPPGDTYERIKKYFAESQAGKASGLEQTRALIPNLVALLVKHLSPQQRAALAIQLFNSAVPPYSAVVPGASEDKPVADPSTMRMGSFEGLQTSDYIETFDAIAQANLYDQIVQKHLVGRDLQQAAEARAGAFEDLHPDDI